jgi:hypothetical protein
MQKTIIASLIATMAFVTLATAQQDKPDPVDKPDPADKTVFDQNHEALERAQQRDFNPPDHSDVKGITNVPERSQDPGGNKDK